VGEGWRHFRGADEARGERFQPSRNHYSIDLMTLSNDLPIRKTANISRDGLYRYELTRRWGEREDDLLPFVMLNPSDADAERDDPTIRRCMEFARREGASGIIVANLFAWRTPYSDELRQADDPFGRDNRKAIEMIAARSIENGIPIVCAWGCRGAFHGGDKSALDIIRGVGPGAILKCLGKTKAGHPRHPLYLRREQPLEEFP